jgi:hypothetical protein
MKAARVFTRDDPCTKVHLWNCFTDARGNLIDRPMVDAKMEIGDNAPKYLIREGYVRARIIGGVDWYVLTESGKTWLRDGTIRYLELHPEARKDCRNPPGKPAPVGRRTRPAKPPETPVKRVIRRLRP